MKILGMEDPALTMDEYGTIHLFQGKRDHHYNPRSSSGKKIQMILITLMVVLEHLARECGDPWAFIRRCEYPALTRIIRTLMFENSMAYRTARKYSWFLKYLADLNHL